MSGEITYQTELDAVEDPLNGEAGEQDDPGQEYQAEIQAAALQSGTAHHHLRLERTGED